MSGPLIVGGSGWLGSRLQRILPGAVVVPASSVVADGGRNVRDLLRDRADLVLNAAGARAGDVDTMRLFNSVLPAILVDVVDDVGGHLVHLGSAAEYGFTESGEWCVEEGPCSPSSVYGSTKLAGTEAVLGTVHGTVLRIFNIASAPAQERTPLADVAERIREGVRLGSDVSLLSPLTVRDWVTLEFVLASIRRALELRPAGVFNIASGVGIQMRDAVQRAIEILNSDVRVRDDGPLPASLVVGRPDRWFRRSGLAESMSVERLATILSVSAA